MHSNPKRRAGAARRGETASGLLLGTVVLAGGLLLALAASMAVRFAVYGIGHEMPPLLRDLGRFWN